MIKKMTWVLSLALALVFPLGASDSAAIYGERGEVSADKAIKLLREGNDRLVKGRVANPHTNKERRNEIVAAQHPIATVLSCADSRVPLERVFDAGFGDIFGVRVAGNTAAGDQVIGTVEYGVLHVGTNLVLVLGHSSCGAVKAALGHHKEKDTSIEGLIKSIQPAADMAKDKLGRLSGQELMEAAVERNVLQSMEDLLMKAPKLAQLVRDGKIKVVGGIYQLATNRVEWIGEHPDQALILSGKKAKSK